MIEEVPLIRKVHIQLEGEIKHIVERTEKKLGISANNITKIALREYCARMLK